MIAKTYSLSSLIFIIAFSATVPQLYQTLSTGLTRDLNFTNLVLNLLTNILMGVHGYLRGDVGLIAIGIWFTMYWSTLLALKGNNQKQGKE
jgi:hypothetical protein